MITNCIRFRVVANDAVCRSWEDMPEVQPPTFPALVAYLRDACGIDPRPLNVAATFEQEGHYLSYGERKQFWLPQPVTSSDREQMAQWHREPDVVLCPVCGGPLKFFESWTEGYYPESYYSAACGKCDLRFTRDRRMSRLAGDLADVLRGARTKPQPQKSATPARHGGMGDGPGDDFDDLSHDEIVGWDLGDQD